MGKGYRVTADLKYIALQVCVWTVLFSLCRLMLLGWNIDLTTGIPLSDILYSFLIGIKFDLMMVTWLMIPAVLGLLLPWGLRARWFYRSWMLVLGAAMLFIATAEMEFYREFHSRLNTIAIQYLTEDAKTVTSMVLHGSPVFTIVLAWLVLVALAVWATGRVDRITRDRAEPMSCPRNYAYRAPVFILVLLLFVIAGRGTVRSGPPLRWGDAFHCEHLFANHLGLNGVFTLSKAALGWNKSKAAHVWKSFRSDAEAEAGVKTLLSVKTDQWLDPEVGLVYRKSEPTPGDHTRIKNVVFIMLESFSGYYVGALGSQDHITPNFDRLAKEGLLFDDFFSNGTHTHQGMFAAFACFPNLPDYEYLMQQPEGDINFSGFPAVMRYLGFKKHAYVYNGDFAWDNQKGFFGKQGVTNFIGRDDYVDPVFVDPTWGVSDQDMFDRALVELDKLDATDPQQPFFGMLQTLSNHLPYALPSPLPVKPVTGHGSRDEHLTAMRYSDWALGQFFAKARQKNWYHDTLFVIFGDHGFGVPEQLTDIDLLRFRVPALLIAPGLRDHYGAVAHVTGSQVDLVPTAAGLLGHPYEHACWGRNLLALPDNDPGFAVIKPSGSDKTVGMISGDKALVKAPDRKPQLYRYLLGPEPNSALIEADASQEPLYNTLGSYLQTALRVLSERRAGQVKNDHAANPDTGSGRANRAD